MKNMCMICEQKKGAFKIKAGRICLDCFKASKHTRLIDIVDKSIDEIKADIEKNKMDQGNIPDVFKATSSIPGYIEFDDNKRQWRVATGIFRTMKKSRIYSYDDIVEYDLLEDGNSITETKGGLGRAVAGGLLFGGVGALVGGSTAKRTTKSFVNSLKIKITVNDFNDPAVFINFITSQTKTDSFMYKTEYESAQKVLSALALLQSKKDAIPSTPTIEKAEQNNSLSVADEIMKFKKLMDDGIITQEQFEAKKNQLLEI